MLNVDSPKWTKIRRKSISRRKYLQHKPTLKCGGKQRWSLIFPDLILCSPPSREYFGSVGGSEADLGNKPNKATCPLSLTPPPLCLAQQNTIYARHKRILFHPLPHTHAQTHTDKDKDKDTQTKRHTPTQPRLWFAICLLAVDVSFSGDSTVGSRGSHARSSLCHF